jgi:hypothetical protein
MIYTYIWYVGMYRCELNTSGSVCSYVIGTVPRCLMYQLHRNIQTQMYSVHICTYQHTIYRYRTEYIWVCMFLCNWYIKHLGTYMRESSRQVHSIYLHTNIPYIGIDHRCCLPFQQVIDHTAFSLRDGGVYSTFTQLSIGWGVLHHP